MKPRTCTDALSHLLACDPPRSKSLVMTIFGDTVVPHGGAVWLGSLIALLAPFGVNDRLLRTSVFRLVQEGWLVASRDGRRSAYAIAPDMLGRFERACRRIYAAPTVHWDGGWTLLLQCGDNDAPTRASLRKQLLWEGYGAIAPGVFGHPAADAAALADLLARAGADGKLFACRATELAGVPARPLRQLVAEGWDLSGVADGYRRFIDNFAPLLALLQQQMAPTPQQAFAVRTLLIHAYRRVQLHDPMLPVELLPQPWPGSQAYQLARALYRLSNRAAEVHVLDTLRREDDRAGAPIASFFQRFGGLDGEN